MSRFGGIPLEEPTASRFGGQPVQPATQPSPAPAPASAEEPGLLARAADIFTGDLREVPATESMPDWGAMPEINQLSSIPGWKAAIGTLMSQPAESVQVIQSNFPGVKVRQDKKGNYVMTSSIDGKDYAIKPGLQPSDIPRIPAAIGAFMAGGNVLGAAKMGGPIIAGAIEGLGTQAAIESSQAATGGSFDGGEVALSGALGGLMPGVSQVIKSARAPAGGVAAQADNVPVMMRDVPSPTAPISQADQETFGALVNEASGRIPTPARAKARNEIAAMAAVNPEAKAAAEKMGIQLPVDVISDARMLKETTGQLRGLKGTDASVAWHDKSVEVMDKARDIMASMDGTPDMSTLSARVQSSIRGTRDDLHKSAKELYDQVDENVPKSMKVDMKNTQALLTKVLADNPNSMTDAEKKLLELATRNDVTYGDLSTIRSNISAALRGIQKGKENYTSIIEYTLGKIDEALNADKALSVGPELAPILKQADRFTAMQKDLEKKVINAFGRDGEGSVASAISASIKSGSAKGDIKQLNHVMNIVPDDMKKEAVMSGIYANSTANGHFSFQKFANLYRGLRDNKEVYKTIAGTMSPDEQEMLRSLYVVSKRMAAAESQVSKTGASLQPLMNSINAQNLIGKVISSTGGKMAAAGIGMKLGGPLGGAVAAGATSKMAEKSAEAGTKRAAEFLSSPEFEKLVLETAKKGDKVDRATVRRTVMSPAFSAFAKEVKIPKDLNARERWVMQAIMAGNQMKEENK